MEQDNPPQATTTRQSPAWEPYQPKSNSTFHLSKLGLFTKERATQHSDDLTSEQSEIPLTTQSHKRVLGLRRRTFFILLLLFLLVLALILGLSIGLTRRSGSSQPLPLPSTSTIQTGALTYYANNLGLGACGLLSSATDNICAVSHILYDAAAVSGNPNENPLCGRMIRVMRYDAGSGRNRSVDVKVIDRCVGCAAMDLDLSLGAFEQVAEEALGRTGGSWAWLS